MKPGILTACRQWRRAACVLLLAGLWQIATIHVARADGWLDTASGLWDDLIGNPSPLGSGPQMPAGRGDVDPLDRPAMSSQMNQPMRGGLDDDHVRMAIVAEAMASYQASGRCLCPDQPDRSGRRCGRTQSVPGYVPLCYMQQVNTQMVWSWRQSHPDGR